VQRECSFSFQYDTLSATAQSKPMATLQNFTLSAFFLQKETACWSHPSIQFLLPVKEKLWGNKSYNSCTCFKRRCSRAPFCTWDTTRSAHRCPPAVGSTCRGSEGPAELSTESPGPQLRDPRICTPDFYAVPAFRTSRTLARLWKEKHTVKHVQC
jgi:hypothetical protein